MKIDLERWFAEPSPGGGLLQTTHLCHLCPYYLENSVLTDQGALPFPSLDLWFLLTVLLPGAHATM